MNKSKILVVDDKDAWLRTIARILGDQYELALTTEPSVAVELVKSSSFALAILDQRFPGDVSGLALFGHLREIRHDLRAIILTGYAEVEDAVESMKIGAFDYISKGRQDLASELRVRVEKALAADRPAEPVSAMIAKGESAELEFKSSARWDLRLNKPSREVEGAIVRTAAAFLNSEPGGVLLIGVDDNGRCVGLSPDYQTLKKPNRDGFENFLMTLLLKSYGKDVSALIHIDFHDVGGNDVCRVAVKPSPRAVFAADGSGGEHLYIRTGNSTRQLSTREAIEYCKMRWK